MVKLKCLIAEDNPVERDLLVMFLRKIELADVVAVCEDGASAMQVLLREKIDIVFTDIEMPELTGINLLKSLSNPPVFVFISAYAKFAADGYDLDVADFILKPVSSYRVIKAFGKAKEMRERTLTQHTETAGSIPTTVDEAGVYLARTSDGLHKLQLNAILYAESKANFSVLHMADGTSHMILVGLKQLEEQLPLNQFMRIHKQFIINRRHVSVINKESLILAGKQEFFVGKKYRQAINDLIASYPLLERRKNG